MSSSGPNSYRGCDDRIRIALWLLSGIQMPIPLPSAISSPSLSLALSFICQLALSLPSPLPQCLSGLVISCHPLQKQITPHTARFPSGSMHTRKTGKHTNTQVRAHACKLKALKNSVKCSQNCDECITVLHAFTSGILIHISSMVTMAIVQILSC